MGSDVHCPTSVGALGGSGPVVVVAANHVTDRFSRFELTRGRKSVEMNSRLSG